MKSLKKIISQYMYQITAILVFFMLLIVLYVQLSSEQKREYENSVQIFKLIKNRLKENEQELLTIKDEYNQTCLYNAELIARTIANDPEILNSLKGMRKLAQLLEVDEIHIFDETGRIFTGTHPQYYDYTFDSGEQMMFFKPMLKNKSLRLVQKITPNTAEGKLMQYSAVWAKNGEYIVQVGMEPVNVNKITKKNEISYIFSSFKVNKDAEYYDVDATDGRILGSSNTESTDYSIEDIGIDFDEIKKDSDGFFANVNGQLCFCVFQKSGDTYLGRIITTRNLYQRIPAAMLILSVCLVFMAFVLSYAVTKHINRYIVDEIYEINDKLNLIAKGSYDETIKVRSSTEFSKLSDHLNSMLNSILDNNRKMSYVLNKTNLLIGVYEYNPATSHVQFTEYVPQIFSVTPDKMNEIASDVDCFKEFIKNIYLNAVTDEPNVYMVGEQYVKLDEIHIKDDVFGVVMDVTTEIQKRKELEIERDIDLLTGLYNRRGLDAKLIELFTAPERLGYYAMIMIDADGLKTINDTYGHESGDVYLKKIASTIRSFGSKDCIASRQGGDEFVLFLYHYESEAELEKAMEALESVQGNPLEPVSDTIPVPLRFSFGYSLRKGTADYHEMLKEADKKMYQNKLNHRKDYYS